LYAYVQVTLAEYLADLMPADFRGNETLAEIEASRVWVDPAHEWVLHNKVLRLLLHHASRSFCIKDSQHFRAKHP
jgi:hypothetical protein